MKAKVISLDAWRNAPGKTVRRMRITSDAQYERELELEDELRKAMRAVERCERVIERAPNDYAQARARLDLDVFISGQRKGQPLSPQRRKQLEQARDYWLTFREKYIAKLPIVRGELARIQKKAKAQGLL